MIYQKLYIVCGYTLQVTGVRYHNRIDTVFILAHYLVLKRQMRIPEVGIDYILKQYTEGGN